MQDDRHAMNGRLVRAAGALALAACIVCSPAVAAINGPVRLDSGQVSGVPARDASITVFKGIPYAAPPTGQLRWRSPQPALPWKGVRKADAFGAACPQNSRLKAPISEDCLFLNVWTAAAAARERRPVFVWLHGNNAVTSEPVYDGEGLARKGLVVVTIDYRNGVFSSLATPELSAESGHNASGDYGYLDQIQALKWVQRNIAAFGGDPSRVLLAGQSRGAASVLHLINSPLAHGLFQRALAESGARNPNDPEISWLAEGYAPRDLAEKQGAAFMQAHGLRSASDLRAVPLEQLMTWTQRQAGPRGDEDPLAPRLRTVMDGWFMPRTFTESLARGPASDVPLITGNNRDESGAEVPPRIKLADYLSISRKKYGAMADEFLRLYPATTDEQAGMASNDAARDASRVSTYTWGVLWRKTAKSPVYTYFWTHALPGQASRGAFHGSEMNYVFDSLDADPHPWTDEDRRIAGIMSSYVVNFAAGGNPNGAGLPAMPALDPKSEAVTEIGDRWLEIPLADPAKPDFWKRFYPTQPAW